MNVMAKKNFDMSDLVEELTSENLLEATRGAESTRKTKNDGKKKVMEHVCTLIETEQMSKVRTISEREGITLKDIFASALNMAIHTYEEKNGVIKVKPARKGSANEVFGI
jgi:NRPS condensation-like uncharacterized protein